MRRIKSEDRSAAKIRSASSAKSKNGQGLQISLAHLVDSKGLDVESFNSKLEVENLKFSYEESDDFELEIDSLKIGKGERVALVGVSGSGKSTFADLILGVLPVRQGDIRISGMKPSQTILKFPGKIGYVPQQANLLGSDVFGNVAVYGESTETNRARVWKCLEMAHLSDQVRSMPFGLDTKIGDGGYKLSGGQKQRLSLARALFSNPELLVLDEATSSLDAETEYDVKMTLEKLSTEVTIVVIAHRLSTIKTFDRLLYFENGRIVADGTFEQLRKSHANFDRQASLSGF
jgi:ABC-type bacteriocin/lantibiotic exporter with double-glycine peptidase domain